MNGNEIGKKTIVGMVAIMACVSVATAAFADTKSAKLTGYGQLKGTLEGRYYETSVTSNPDNAILNGKTLIAQKKLESRRGDRSLSGYWTGMPSNTSKIQPHQLEENKNTTVVMGSLAHQFTNLKYDNNGEMIPLRYDGGELKIDYSVSASGEAKNVGFLLFVDGFPQPYRLNAPEAPYQYMHIIDPEKDDQETPLAFLFTPVTGKQGDTPPVSIASVYSPAFIPDLAATSSYGGYHAILRGGWLRRFCQRRRYSGSFRDSSQ